LYRGKSDSEARRAKREVKEEKWKGQGGMAYRQQRVIKSTLQWEIYSPKEPRKGEEGDNIKLRDIGT